MTQDSREKLLAHEKISKLIIKFAIPAIIGMMVMGIYNFVDAYFIGMIGTQALGAATVGFPFFMLISSIGLTFGVGGASYLSRTLGKKDYVLANKITSTTIISAAAIGLICAAISLPFIKNLALIFGATEGVLNYAVDYISILAMGSVFTIVNMTTNNLLRAEGSVKVSMLGMLIGALLNIAFDPIFIFAFGLGVKGAAMATVLAQMISTIVLIGYYKRGKSMVKLSFKYFTFKLNLYYEIIKIGSPTLIRQFLASSAMAILNGKAGVFGDAALAGIGVINRIFMVGMYVLFGFAQGFQPVAGYNYGAKRFDRVEDAIFFSMKISTVFSVLYAASLAVFAPNLVSILTDDPEVAVIAAKGLRYLAISTSFFGISIIINVLFQSLGKALPAAILSLSRQGIFLVPALIVMPSLLGLDGVLLSQTVADIFTLLLTLAIGIPMIRNIHKLKNEYMQDKNDSKTTENIAK